MANKRLTIHNITKNMVTPQLQLIMSYPKEDYDEKINSSHNHDNNAEMLLIYQNIRVPQGL